MKFRKKLFIATGSVVAVTTSSKTDLLLKSNMVSQETINNLLSPSKKRLLNYV
ncbi:hypothetical protein SAMN02745179_00906 [Mycoplasmopsis agassizii]|nr:hypothetical protein SAMN02745179_00906 [Mycoplasmopsis agassizii]